jgi:hypothetical protein
VFEAVCLLRWHAMTRGALGREGRIRPAMLTGCWWLAKDGAAAPFPPSALSGVMLLDCAWRAALAFGSHMGCGVLSGNCAVWSP